MPGRLATDAPRTGEAPSALDGVRIAAADGGPWGEAVLVAVRDGTGADGVAIVVGGSDGRVAAVDWDLPGVDHRVPGVPLGVTLRGPGASFPLPLPAGAGGLAVGLGCGLRPGGVIACHLATPGRLDAAAAAFLRAAARVIADELGRGGADDPLGRLPDRPAIAAHLADRLAGPDAGSVAAVFVDLDDFKAVNDTLGHDAGDAVLAACARRFARTLRAGDVLARLGGDEFLAACTVEDEAAAAALAERLVESLRRPMRVAGTWLHLSGSAGFALARPGRSVDALLADADLAMYRAKQRSGPSTEGYHPRLRRSADRRRRVGHDLRHAVAGGPLALGLSPVVDPRTGESAGVEATLRWSRPDHADLAGGALFAEAAHHGLAADLAARFATDAVAGLARLDGHPPGAAGRLVLALPAPLAGDAAAVAAVAAAVEEVAGRVDLCLDERAFAALGAPGLTALLGLRDLGARVCLDGFGGAGCGLSGLVELPLDAVRLDGTLVGAVATAHDHGLLGPIAALVRERGLALLAAGARTAGQLDALAAAGCEAASGPAVEGRGAPGGVPVPEPERRAGEVGQCQGEDAAAPTRVLVVEDDPAQAELATVLLGAAGYEVVVVDGAPGFRSEVLAGRVDLVLLDLRLGGASGLDLLDGVAGDLAAPVIVLTAYPHWVIDRDDRLAGVDSVLVKPVEPAVLLARVRAVLARAG